MLWATQGSIAIISKAGIGEEPKRLMIRAMSQRNAVKENKMKAWLYTCRIHNGRLANVCAG